MGTVIDVNGGPVAGATIALIGPEITDRRTVVTADNGFFTFENVNPSPSYRLDITANGFSDWTSPVIALAPGEIKLLETIQLALAEQQTTVRVSGDPVEIATQQVKFEESQRVFGVIPNFYISYEGDNAAPLTTGMKFKLALKVSSDPVTFAAIAFVAGIRQAEDYPDYPQGMKGYTQRFGATAGPVLTDIMIGGAILPSVLHQDPRYFYQGTGTTGSRLRHALLAPFICKGDNGKWQPNYSTVGGDLASAALANLYYPPSNRGAEFVFSTFAIGTVERVVSTVAQEFVLDKYTHRRVQAN
ncbi:MAG TPA: carboxypeptidase-like regulatory domain-containing protein [Candidatus Acidoferrum sp.]|nr:carboxypeptidase-like regulatory domain-containing protein [Candidatus Acidoferrum sp.]